MTRIELMSADTRLAAFPMIREIRRISVISVPSSVSVLRKLAGQPAIPGVSDGGTRNLLWVCPCVWGIARMCHDTKAW